MPYDNTNSGALFKGEKKEPTHADYTGTLNVEGKEYWINAWVKKSTKGTPYMSLSVRVKGQKADENTAARKRMDDDLPDDLPF